LFLLNAPAHKACHAPIQLAHITNVEFSLDIFFQNLNMVCSAFDDDDFYMELTTSIPHALID
jgi:hypothetical protein